MELPLISDVLEAPPSSDPNDLVVEWIACVQQVLEDLVHNRLLFLSNLDGDPLRDDNGDASADDVEARLLLASFSHQRLLEECIEIQLIMQDVGSKTNGRIDGIFEQYVFVVRRCDGQYASVRLLGRLTGNGVKDLEQRLDDQIFEILCEV